MRGPTTPFLGPPAHHHPRYVSRTYTQNPVHTPEISLPYIHPKSPGARPDSPKHPAFAQSCLTYPSRLPIHPGLHNSHALHCYRQAHLPATLTPCVLPSTSTCKSDCHATDPEPTSRAHAADPPIPPAHPASLCRHAWTDEPEECWALLLCVARREAAAAAAAAAATAVTASAGGADGPRRRCRPSSPPWCT